MASNVTLTSNANYNTIKTVWSQQSQSISGNSSVLRATITHSTAGYSEWKSASTITLKVGSQTKTKNVPAFYFGSAGSKDLGYVDFTVDHKTDGKQSASISHSWNIFNQSASGTFTFDTIPRTSTFTIPSSFNVGSAFTVNITRASSSFTHQVSLHDGSTSLYWSENTVTTSASPNIAANTLLARMSGVKSKTFRVEVSTWNGSTYIASTSKTITANIPTHTFTIPSSFTMGNSVTASVSRVASSLKSQISIWNGSTALHYGDFENTASISVATDLSKLANTSPNSTSKTFVIKVTTYNGDTYIGSTSKNITGNVPSTVKPTFSAVTASENISTVASLVGAFVQTKSRLNLAITGASGIYGSTIRSYNITGVGHNANSSSTLTGYLSVSGNQTIKGTVTDSRGQTFEKSIVVNILPYTAPTLSNLSFRRTLPDKTEAPLGDNATVIANVKVQSLIVNGVEKNSIKYHVQSAQTGYSFADKANTTSTSLTENYSDVWSGYLVDYSYNFRVRTGDVFGFGGWSVGVIPTGIVTQQWGSKTTSFGKMIDNTSYNVQVGTGGIQNDGEYVTSNSNPAEETKMRFNRSDGSMHSVVTIDPVGNSFRLHRYTNTGAWESYFNFGSDGKFRAGGIQSDGDIIDKNGNEVLGAYDYVIDGDTNAYGTWEKWASGKLIQWGIVQRTTTSTGYAGIPMPIATVAGSIKVLLTTPDGYTHRFLTVNSATPVSQTSTLDAYVSLNGSGWAGTLSIKWYCVARWK